jgi:hypothetical protein
MTLIPLWVRVPAIMTLVLVGVLIGTMLLGAWGDCGHGSGGGHGSGDQAEMRDRAGGAGGHGSGDQAEMRDGAGGGGGHGSGDQTETRDQGR